MIPDTHLDLGCGTRPRNPYGRARLFGVDIRPLTSTAECEFRAANVVLDPIPFESNSMGSVSAFDFFEHVPRLLLRTNAPGTRFPFVELMDEIWRVLAPGGRLYAITPAYPHAAAFHDPTHVNIIGDETHEYFTEPRLEGRIYGFTGHFRVVRVERVILEQVTDARHRLTLAERWRRFRWARAGRLSHLLWELEAVKA